MAAIPTFPLLGLPEKEVLRTIRIMDLELKLKFSFISKRCKNLVKSIRTKGTSIHVSIRNYITISLGTVSGRMSLRYYTEPDMYWGVGAYGRKKRLTPPQSVLRGILTEGDFWRPPSRWTKMEYTMKDWLRHLQEIFSYHKIDKIQFMGNSSEFDIDDIKEVFGNTTEVDIKDTGCFVFNQKILQNFSPLEKLSIFTDDLPNSEIPASILMQNFANLKIEMGETTSNALDELLLMNSKVITIEEHHIMPKQLNKFIKLWQRGSNPHMEYLYIYHLEGERDAKEIIMKGIKHDVVPDNRTRMFKSVGLTCSYRVRGGMDIYRMDGTKATIQIQYHDLLTFEMYVWFDHCVVES